MERYIDFSFLFTTDIPSVLLRKGQFEKYNVMLGVTDNEGSLLTNAIPGTMHSFSKKKSLLLIDRVSITTCLS